MVKHMSAINWSSKMSSKMRRHLELLLTNYAAMNCADPCEEAKIQPSWHTPSWPRAWPLPETTTRNSAEASGRAMHRNGICQKQYIHQGQQAN
jgi:hypothetical protein